MCFTALWSASGERNSWVIWALVDWIMVVGHSDVIRESDGEPGNKLKVDVNTILPDRSIGIHEPMGVWCWNSSRGYGFPAALDIKSWTIHWRISFLPASTQRSKAGRATVTVLQSSIRGRYCLQRDRWGCRSFEMKADRVISRNYGRKCYIASGTQVLSPHVNFERLACLAMRFLAANKPRGCR